MVFPVFAEITIGPNGVWLGYGNGTTDALGMGSYQSIERIDNVWYVNGEIYPAISSTSDALAIAALAFILAIGAMGLVLLNRSKRR